MLGELQNIAKARQMVYELELELKPPEKQFDAPQKELTVVQEYTKRRKYMLFKGNSCLLPE